MEFQDGNKLTLDIGKWYSWQMLPGYGWGPYFSPIKIFEFRKLKENNLIELGFHNACYAQGVQSFTLTMKVLWHVADYLIVKLQPVSSDRVAIIGNINYEWLEKNITMEKIASDMPIEDFLDKHF